MHFIPNYESISAKQLANIFIQEVVARHGVPVSVVSGRDVRFTSIFWLIFHAELGTSLHFSTNFHPQNNGQSEHTM